MTNRFVEMLMQINKSCSSKVPTILETHAYIDDLVHLLFPIKDNCQLEPAEIEVSFAKMRLRLKELLIPVANDLEFSPDKVADAVFDAIPDVYEKLVEDAQYFLESDPAANSLEEIVVCYPGFYALITHRLANLLFRQKVPLLPRIVSEYTHSKAGIDIHPGARIGRRCYIDHGTGIVIGETTVVGDDVKIYQGVTLGATFVAKRLKGSKRHPTIEDRVIIYAGATILGGDTVIGHDTTVGGNVWITESVPPNSVVYKPQPTVGKDKKK